MKNLPMDLLRTFTVIYDQGGFTQAGRLLGRSQPAISLQMKRLEEILKTSLFIRSKGLQLTEEGHVLYITARKILELNDAIVFRLATPEVSGSVRIGIPNDFETTFLPVQLSKFSRAFPNVTLDVVSDVSINLRNDFKKGKFDIVMSMDSYPTHSFSENDYIIESLSWISDPGFIFNKEHPLPLIVYPEGCIYRQHITNALNEASIAWRVTYCSSSLLGIQSAIKAGLGISALVIGAIPDHFQTDQAKNALPDLGLVTIGFHYDLTHLSAAASLLLDFLRRGLKQTQVNNTSGNLVQSPSDDFLNDN